MRFLIAIKMLSVCKEKDRKIESEREGCRLPDRADI